MIQECEAAIVRIRAALRAGNTSSEEVGADFEFITRSVTPRLIGLARRELWISPVLLEEALDAMRDRIFDDIWSLTFVSLETQFGAYLRSMATRVLFNLQRKHFPQGVSEPVERLDEPVGEDGLLRHETVDDPRAMEPFQTLGDDEELREAIAGLPPDERQVIRLRLQDVENNEIARQLGVSAATATRIYQRAVDRLRRGLNPPQESPHHAG